MPKEMAVEDKRGWSSEKVRGIAYCEQCWICDL